MNLKVFTGSPFQTNIYIVFDEESKDCILIDPADSVAAAAEFIKKNGLSLKYLVLTHGHGDHTGGIDFFREQFPGVLLCAGKAERNMLFNRDISHGKGGIKADIELSDGDALDAGTIHMDFIATPGHTKGGMSVLINGALFAGDTLFYGSVGRTDLAGGDFETLIKSIKEKLFVLPDETPVFPGHGQPTKIGFEKRYNPFV